MELEVNYSIILPCKFSNKLYLLTYWCHKSDVFVTFPNTRKKETWMDIKDCTSRWS